MIAIPKRVQSVITSEKLLTRYDVDIINEAYRLRQESSMSWDAWLRIRKWYMLRVYPLTEGERPYRSDVNRSRKDECNSG